MSAAIIGDYERLSELIFSELKPRLEGSQGLSIFAKERAKFEGWLKVELCDILSSHFQDVVPEKDRIDITFDEWAIQLKTLNTNYTFPSVKAKTRPITKNVEGVIEDVEKLRSVNLANRGVLFVVFPATPGHKDWQMHLSRISGSLRRLSEETFSFLDKIPGIIYFGLV